MQLVTPREVQEIVASMVRKVMEVASQHPLIIRDLECDPDRLAEDLCTEDCMITLEDNLFHTLSVDRLSENNVLTIELSDTQEWSFSFTSLPPHASEASHYLSDVFFHDIKVSQIYRSNSRLMEMFIGRDHTNDWTALPLWYNGSLNESTICKMLIDQTCDSLIGFTKD